ncbi:MAG: polyhydroxyalkanoate synthesis regulator DNA-binding domain-containing protein [Cyclonatronaceae bacterium]
MPRHIKKYGNRKLYDVSESRYIALSELKELIRGGETLVITDSKSGQDITSQILTKALVEQGGGEMLTPDALHALIRWGSETFERGLALFGKSLHKFLPLASNEEVSSLSQRIRELETRVDGLNEQLEKERMAEKDASS